VCAAVIDERRKGCGRFNIKIDIISGTGAVAEIERAVHGADGLSLTVNEERSFSVECLKTIH
jgi:hypothetical protein